MHLSAPAPNKPTTTKPKAESSVTETDHSSQGILTNQPPKPSPAPAASSSQPSKGQGSQHSKEQGSQHSKEQGSQPSKEEGLSLIHI